jgi:hypothetical membrane protein
MHNNPQTSIRTRALLACGAIGCPLFILVFLIAGAIRPDYSLLRHPVSSLSIGALGWIQVANFIVTGLSVLAFAMGLRRALSSSIGAVWGPLLIGLVGIGLIGAGAFTTDPVYGYPPDAPLLLASYSTQGHFHDLFSFLVFLGLPIACFVFTRRFAALGERGWAIYSASTGIAMLATFVLAGMGFSQMPGFVDLAGAYQRLSIIIGWTWMTLLALHLLRNSKR